MAPLTTTQIEGLKNLGLDTQQIAAFAKQQGNTEAEVAAIHKATGAPDEEIAGALNLGETPAEIEGPNAPAKKKTTAAAPSASTIEQQIQAENAFGQMGESLAKEEEQLTKPAEQAVSGALTKPAESNAAATALGSLGLSPNSSASSWLNDQITQANAADSPMQQAMAAYGKAFQTGTEGIANALGGMGQANQEEIETAPQQDLLNALGQHLASNINYYGQVPTSLAGSIAPFLQYYLAQSGAGGTSPTGVESITALPGANSPLAPGGKIKTPAGLPSVGTAATQGAAPGVPADVANANAG